MFDLNKTPILVEGEVNPRDSGTEKKLHIQSNSATSTAPKTVASSSTNSPFDPAELASLLIMVEDLPNDHSSTPNLMFNTDHARLPPHTSAFTEAPAPGGRSSRSAVPKNLAAVTATTSDGAPAVRDAIVSPLFKHGRVVEVWSRNGAGGGLCGTPNRASQCQTTMDLDSHVASDAESDSCKSRNSRDNSNSKALLVDLDTLPDESPVELQLPWSPVHQGEAPLLTPTLQGSSENLQVSAANLTPKELEEEHIRRELAFHAAFKLQTVRCTPTARCRSCLAFCQARLPKWRFPGSLEGCGPGRGLQLREECPPVLRNVVDDDAGPGRKMARHGPKSKSSEYRGVTFYKRTGRWEAHIWHEGAQVYLGASRTKEEAARAYDQAALLLCGPDVETNFKPESYQQEMAYLYKLTKEQLVMYLRRDSRGFGANVSYPGVKLVKNFYQATYGLNILGTFALEEDAARAVYEEAVRDSFGALATLILDTHHVRNMPSYAAQRFAALYPEAVEGTQLRNQAQAITSKRPSVPGRPANLTSTPRNKKLFTHEATKPNQVKENTEVPPGALSPIRSGSASLAPRTHHHHAAGINLTAAQHLGSHPHQPSNYGTNAPAPQQYTQLRNMLPKFVRASVATAASSSCHAASVPSIPRSTGEASSSGVIKFKLFNVEISVAAEPGQGGDRTEAHGESEPQLCDQAILPKRKRSRITGAAEPNKLCRRCVLTQGRRFKATEG